MSPGSDHGGQCVPPAQIAIPEDQIAAFCARWNVAELSLFGSVLRDDFRPESDVDILIAFASGAPPRLADLLHMQDELEVIFGRGVDLVERDAVERSENYIRRRHILASAQPIYVAR